MGNNFAKCMAKKVEAICHMGIRLWYVDYKISPMDWFDMEYQLHKLPIVADKNLASAP